MASKNVVQLRNIRRALKLDPANDVNYVISGRISKFRVYKSFNFLDLIDGSTKDHLQVVINKEIFKKPQLGSYVICQGNIIPSRGGQQRIEFKANKVKFASKCDPDKWPLASTKTDDWFRRHPHLRPQADHFASLLRFRSELELSLHLIFKQMDFFKVHTPILSSNDSEASSDLFIVHRHKQKGQSSMSCGDQESQRETDHEPVPTSESSVATEASTGAHRDYFKKDVFMVTSAQLHLEALAASLSRVYTLAPAFRAENSLSRRHLCEFTMLEAEEANVTQLDSLMDRVESLLKFSAHFVGEVSDFSVDFHQLLERYSNHEVYTKMANSAYIRMTYDEAMKVLRELHSSPTGSRLLSDLPLSDCDYGCDISRRHERHLLAHCRNVPIFITNYPRQLKPFYMKCEPQEGREALCFDLIAPFGGEICGGSLREDDSLKLPEASEFQWYRDLREFGSFPHGGFGIGLERLIQSLIGVPNIRDTIAFPRWAGSCIM